MKKLLVASVVCFMAVSLTAPIFTFAQAVNDFGLDARNTYDIYIGSRNDNLSIIKSVQIMGLRTVGDKTFLVVQTDDFAGKRSEGLIALGAVQAILPSFRTSGIQQIQTR